jgi:hypothetical protein
MSSRAALSGSLTDLPLPDLLALVGSKGQAGVIELTGSTPGLLVLAPGGITLALSDAGPTLQQVVVGSGLTGSDGWETAHLASLRGAPLAQALIDTGADPIRVEAVLREQIVGALFEFLVGADAEFAFLPGATHPIGDLFVFPADDLLADARARLDAWKVIAEAIPSVNTVMRLTRELPHTDITIALDDWRVLARVDGCTTIEELIRELGMSSFAVCGVLHRLVLAGAVETAGPD